MDIADFYRKSKILVNKWTGELIEPVTVAIKFVGASMEKEVFFNMPKGFKAKEYFLPKFFGEKAEEANILFTYLIKSKEFIKKDREFSESRFNLLIAGLRLLMVKKYMKCNWLYKFIQLFTVSCSFCLASIKDSSTYDNFINLPKQVRAHIERAETYIGGGF